jgi:glutathione synthase/RimK-type ligase-like ATP-grasp enzyme
MKTVLLVGGLSSDGQDNPSLQEFSAYMHEVLEGEYRIASTYLDDIVYTITPDGFEAYDARSQQGIGDVDVIYIRGPKMRLLSTHAYYLSRYCAARQIPCINDYSLYYPGTKLSQAIIFKQNDAPFLPTMYGVRKEALITRAAEVFGFPYILKTNVGSHGDSNYLIKQQADAEAILASEPGVDFLAQGFCPNDRDYRVLCMADKHLIFERRGQADTHINNTSKGGEATRTDDVLPADILEKCHRISQELNLKISGVDVMPHLETGAFYFLEINSQPQLRTGALLSNKKDMLRELFADIPPR